jgi:hypothetical protein
VLEMPRTLEDLHAMVGDCLGREFAHVDETDAAGFTIRHDSARAFISCTSSDDSGFTVVNVEAPLLFDVPESGELFEFIALHADDYVFGHLSASRSDDRKIVVVFSHALLGDYLDDEELVSVVTAVLGVGNELDDELQRRFGGSRFHEDGESPR